MNLLEKITQMSPEEAAACLNGMLKGWSATNPDLELLIQSPEDMASVIRQVADEKIDEVREPSEREKDAQVRKLLVEIAQRDDLRPRLENYLETRRQKLLDPVTSALVLAGIMMVLGTDIKVGYQNKNGKKKLKVTIHKKASPVSLLKKFFELF